MAETAMPLWVDTDMGFDDLMAVFLLKHAGVKIDGLSLVAGNTPIDQVVRNTIAAACCFGWPEPVHRGAAVPISARQETAAAVLGATGMQSIGLQLPPPGADAMRALSHTDALTALSDWLREQTVPAKILALGPLTNIAEMIVAHPELAGTISELVWMGGSAGAGNQTEHAEFNAFVDPEAIEIVLKSGVPTKMVGLDVCREVTLVPEDASGLQAARGKHANLLADLLAGYIRIAIDRGRDAMAVYDPTAAATIVDPDAISFAPAQVNIHLTGTPRRGMTEIDASRTNSHNILLANGADSGLVREMTLQALQSEAER